MDTRYTWQEADMHLRAAMRGLLHQRDAELFCAARRANDFKHLAAGATVPPYGAGPEARQRARADFQLAKERHTALEALVESVGELIDPLCPDCGVNLGIWKYPTTHENFEGELCGFYWNSPS